MTIVGKILVFFNLLLACAVGTFAVWSYTVRFNYDAAYKDLKNNYSAAQANAKQYYSDAQQARTDADSRVNLVEGQVKTLRDEIEGYKAQLTKDATRVANAEAKSSQWETVAKAAEADVLRRQADTEKLRDTLAVEIARNTTLVKSANEEREKRVAAELQTKSQMARLAQMENQLQDTTKELARVKQNAGTSGRGLASRGANPPPENVEGLVKTADADGRLLKLTIGSDSGLAAGHTLELYRLSSIASQNKYLGQVRILNVTPHEAVAQPLGRLNDKPQAGDRVASHILGGA
jgi:hypothetical protein